jgi:hypothetical protein
MTRTPYKEVELAEVIIDHTTPLSFDIETCGLYGRIRLAQFYQPGWPEVLIVNNPNPYELAVLLQNVHFIAHNGHYEVSCIQYATHSKWAPDNLDDTLYLSRLKYFAKLEFSLDQVLDYTLGFDPYAAQGLNKAVLQKSNWDVVVLSESQKLYAATDVYYLPDVWEACKVYKDDISYRLDMLALKYSFDFQGNGMPIIPAEINKKYAKNVAAVQRLDVPINVNSWQQVRPYIGENSSDGLALATFALEGNTRAREVQAARKLLKQNSFLDKYTRNEDNRVYGLFKPGARSGRFTSNNENQQQHPRELKECFGYEPGEGMCLTYADYAQLEMRTIASITGDLRMAGVLRANEDLHDFTAKMLFGENFTKAQRQIAKTCNFNLLYGGGAAMLRSILIQQASLMITIAEANAYKYKWGNIYPAVKAWQKNGIEAYHQGAPWSTPFGRKYKAKLMTDQLNIQNQGAGAEVAKLSMHYMYEEYKDVYEPLGCKYVNFIHDAHAFENPDDPAIYEPLAALVAKSMQEAWFEFLRSANGIRIRDLPMPVDVFVGYNWGRIEKDYLHKLELDGMKYAA